MTSEYRRQHPVAAISRTIKAIRRNFLTFIIALLAGQSGGEDSQFDATFLFIVLGAMLVWGVVSWFRFMYYIKDGALWIEQGVFVRRQLYLPQERIQLIDFKSDFIQRMFGLVSLRVQTAGGSQDTEISALNREEADWIRDELRPDSVETEQEGSTYDSNAEKPSETTDEASSETSAASSSTSAKPRERKGSIIRDRVDLPFRDLLLAGVTSASLGIAFSIIGTILAQFDQVLSESQIMVYMKEFIKTDFGFIMTILVFLLLVSLILAFLGTVIRYYGFNVTKYDQEIVIERGLFERSTVTIPFRRVQAIRFQEGIMRQPLGYGALLIDSAGFAEEAGQTTMLFPLIRKRNVEKMIQRLVPDFDYEIEASSPPFRAMRRFLLPKTLFFVLLSTFLSIFWEAGIYLFALLPLIWFWGYLQYRDTAFAFSRKGKLALRYRNISRTTVLMNKERIQDLQIEQNPFQRRGKVGDIQVSAASGPSGVKFTVQNMADRVIETFKQWFSGKEQSSQIQATQTHLPDWR